MKHFLAVAALAALASPAFADAHLGSGDPAAGEAAFSKCQSCHVVQNDAGEVLAGRNAKTGPNLFGVVGRQAGTVDGFRYKKSIVEAGEGGLVWDAATIAAYLQDPTAFLKETLGDNGARSGMAFKVRSEEEAADLAAFLATFGQGS
ncbi:c-type cytochrome [Silicimonas sp. MF1-12-2]|uniref:c-type cytochrome n=1 Tax=Silicimonas sp. MF1-12-2 TaxID=3384793 RepID=UPI0039B42B3E